MCKFGGLTVGTPQPHLIKFCRRFLVNSVEVTFSCKCKGRHSVFGSTLSNLYWSSILSVDQSVNTKRIKQYLVLPREAEKKVIFLVARGSRGVPLREKKMALLAQKLWRNFLLSKSVSGYFKTKIVTEKKFL